MSDFEDGLAIQVEEGERGPILRIAGELTLAGVGRIRKLLLERLAPGTRVVADCSRVTEIDLSGLQILCSTHRTYVAWGATFEVLGRSDSLVATARTAGYCGRPVCSHRQGDCCVW